MLSWRAEEAIAIFENGERFVGGGYYFTCTDEPYRLMLCHTLMPGVPIAEGTGITKLRQDLIDKLELYSKVVKDMSSSGAFTVAG